MAARGSKIDDDLWLLHKDDFGGFCCGVDFSDSTKVYRCFIGLENSLGFNGKGDDDLHVVNILKFTDSVQQKIELDLTESES